MDLFNKALQAKINNIINQSSKSSQSVQLNHTDKSIILGKVKFSSPYLLAPMSSITNFPFRYLMQRLGCGGSISELVSCHGINYKSQKTLKMLEVGNKEKHVGIQLFGEDASAMSNACQIACQSDSDFLDLNLGCPVNKVVKKGGGSALLRDTSKLAPFFNSIIKSSTKPVSIKIRIGWDELSLNADEVIHIAKEEGISFVSIHGRTRSQQYRGQANWKYLTWLSNNTNLPLIGNGDLTSVTQINNILTSSNFKAIMIGRGCLRHPFIFLECLQFHNVKKEVFTPLDYLQIINAYHLLLLNYISRESFVLIQLKKISVWFLSGFKNATKIRSLIFSSKTSVELLKIVHDYLEELEINNEQKSFYNNDNFLCGGHG